MAPTKGSRKAVAIYIAAIQTEERRRLMARGQDVSVADLKKICADKWKELSDGQKKKYYDMAEEEKEEDKPKSKKKRSAEEKENDDDDDEKPKKVKKVKDPNAPKKNLTSYFCFLREQRPILVNDNPELKSSEVIKELGKMWKELDEEEKDKYVKLAAIDKKRYERDMEVYAKN